MSSKTEIEWTDATWNPVVGCKAISPGCDNCYAARQTGGRLSANPTYAGLTSGGVFTGEVRMLPDRLDKPLHWRKPRRIFVNSMSDLFHNDIDPRFVCDVFDVMANAYQHSFQVLTKRPQIMAKLVRSYYEGAFVTDWAAGPLAFAVDKPIKNIWLGTSIESDRYTFRANWLRDTPAAVRFLSLEPLLGPLPSLDLTGIDWVIVGGESGPKARWMHPDWARDIRDRCVAAGVPFLFKQWGEWAAGEFDPRVDPRGWRCSVDPRFAGSAVRLDDGQIMYRAGKHGAGRELDGRTWDEYPIMGATA